jgi:DNA modification methylase
MAVNTQVITDKYAIYHGDSCEVLPSLPDESVGFSVYSPPFAELYNYSSSERDLSNCRNYDEFLAHYEFIVREIARVTKPGRLSAIHCMDLKGAADAYRDFPGDIIRLYERHGFYLHAKITIWKEPYAVRMRTMIRGLAHKQIVEDSSLCGVANPDWLIVMRKGGTNQVPIVHPEGLTEFAGIMDPTERAKMGFAPIPAKYLAYKGRTDLPPRENKWSHWIWRQYASCVWMDVRAGRLLPHRECKEKEEEKHICPLQLDVIERAITLWSNPGEVVLTPFLGVGSEAYMAVKMGRRAIGVELKESYFRQAVKNVEEAAAGHFEHESDLFSDADCADDEEPAE